MQWNFSTIYSFDWIMNGTKNSVFIKLFLLLLLVGWILLISFVDKLNFPCAWYYDLKLWHCSQARSTPVVPLFLVIIKKELHDQLEWKVEIHELNYWNAQNSFHVQCVSQIGEEPSTNSIELFGEWNVSCATK